jgi:surfeit locus 1 family protein
LLLLLATLLSFALFVRLGFWQLDRAAQKIGIQNAVLVQSQHPVTDDSWTQSSGKGADLSAWQYRPVQVSGTWLHTHTVYLENRQMGGQTGFLVLTPLRLEGRDDVVLVQRGVAPRDFRDRSRLPKLQTPTDPVHLQGRLSQPPSLIFAFEEGGDGQIRHNLDLAQYAQDTGLALLPLTIQQTSPDSDLLQHWTLPPDAHHKHYGYAFQWFGLAALVFILWMWFQIVRPRFFQRQT